MAEDQGRQQRRVEETIRAAVHHHGTLKDFLGGATTSADGTLLGDEDGPATWARLLAAHGPCRCPATAADDVTTECPGPLDCRLCWSLPEEWPCPAWAGAGYGGQLEGEELRAWFDAGIATQVAHAKRRAGAELYHGALVASIQTNTPGGASG